MIPTLTACAGEIDQTFNPVVSPAGNYSYLWTPDDGTLSSLTIANPFVLVAEAGTRQYNLQVTDNTTGCSNNATANLVVNECTGLGDLVISCGLIPTTMGCKIPANRVSAAGM